MNDILKRISGVVLIVIGIVVAIYTIVEPLLHVSSEEQMYGPLWDILNPLMVLAVVLGAIFSCIRKRGVGSEGGSGAITREYLAANTLFYGFLFLGILLLWSWFNKLSPEYTSVGEDASTLVWILIDATLPLLSGAMGLFLLRGSSNNE